MEFVFGFRPQIDSDPAKWNAEELADSVIEKAQRVYESKFTEYGPDVMRQIEQWALLDTVDTYWKEHLLNMDHLKEGIGLRGYAQKDPLREYQREGYEMFSAMAQNVQAETVAKLMRVQLASPDELEDLAPQDDVPLSYSGGDESGPEPVKRSGAKVGRNDPCPCGSGKKYKKCCGLKQ